MTQWRVSCPFGWVPLHLVCAWMLRYSAPVDRIDVCAGGVVSVCFSPAVVIGMSRIQVLGTGVLGLSTAIALRCAGHDVTLRGERHLTDADANTDPFFASAYPAASVIPHTVRSPILPRLAADAQAVFAILASHAVGGVRRQTHYEISEQSQVIADHLQGMPDFRACDGADVPILRSGAEQASGCSFTCFFCDMPVYGAWLAERAQALGITWMRERITLQTVKTLTTTDVVVNCLGAGAHQVFADVSPGVLIRGILVRAELLGVRPPPVSYNYTPAAAVFPSPGPGPPADVYFYPRTDHCVLGGTRQTGRVNREGRFVPDHPYDGPTLRLSGVDVPQPIVELNRELVLQLTGQRIGAVQACEVGYRHMDLDGDGGATLTLRRLDRTGLPPAIDCFGFGGAGVTLSWGAALHVGSLIAAMESSAPLNASQLAAALV